MEGRADMAWGGMRDERGREKLCLRDGGDGKGKCLEHIGTYWVRTNLKDGNSEHLWEV